MLIMSFRIELLVFLLLLGSFSLAEEVGQEFPVSEGKSYTIQYNGQDAFQLQITLIGTIGDPEVQGTLKVFSNIDEKYILLDCTASPGSEFGLEEQDSVSCELDDSTVYERYGELNDLDLVTIKPSFINKGAKTANILLSLTNDQEASLKKILLKELPVISSDLVVGAPFLVKDIQVDVWGIGSYDEYLLDDSLKPNAVKVLISNVGTFGSTQVVGGVEIWSESLKKYVRLDCALAGDFFSLTVGDSASCFLQDSTALNAIGLADDQELVNVLVHSIDQSKDEAIISLSYSNSSTVRKIVDDPNYICKIGLDRIESGSTVTPFNQESLSFESDSTLEIDPQNPITIYLSKSTVSSCGSSAAISFQVFFESTNSSENIYFDYDSRKVLDFFSLPDVSPSPPTRQLSNPVVLSPSEKVSSFTFLADASQLSSDFSNAERTLSEHLSKIPSTVNGEYFLVVSQIGLDNSTKIPVKFLNVDLDSEDSSDDPIISSVGNCSTIIGTINTILANLLAQLTGKGLYTCEGATNPVTTSPTSTDLELANDEIGLIAFVSIPSGTRSIPPVSSFPTLTLLASNTSFPKFATFETSTNSYGTLENFYFFKIKKSDFTSISESGPLNLFVELEDLPDKSCSPDVVDLTIESLKIVKKNGSSYSERTVTPTELSRDPLRFCIAGEEFNYSPTSSDVAFVNN